MPCFEAFETALRASFVNMFRHICDHKMGCAHDLVLYEREGRAPLAGKEYINQCEVENSNLYVEEVRRSSSAFEAGSKRRRGT